MDDSHVYLYGDCQYSANIISAVYYQGGCIACHKPFTHATVVLALGTPFNALVHKQCLLKLNLSDCWPHADLPATYQGNTEEAFRREMFRATSQKRPPPLPD